MKAVEWRRRVKQERERLVGGIEAGEAELLGLRLRLAAEKEAKQDCVELLDRLLREDAGSGGEDEAE